mmetsp:Transcript_7048/g.9436  ORF Transcript_7048/g.9436 Transcript_7048/m.9436 type:complete len:162 (-) Transcript_7048:1538-2023(-)|eukprot:CAMPEP_0117743908 /NCGR_PEP_ID=MMETSP0947-20121206/6424_1 /TAXON_ID=44440 /ORGANISM="Chattonella subsalsa, Strain CCMP2191" /LENGTH=161 /DNA_ID=CAMNT_0005560717 /DNA_START=989 /DNA_END=1474 /DNA_ORIENTATION=-
MSSTGFIQINTAERARAQKDVTAEIGKFTGFRGFRAKEWMDRFNLACRNREATEYRVYIFRNSLDFAVQRDWFSKLDEELQMKEHRWDDLEWEFVSKFVKPVPLHNSSFSVLWERFQRKDESVEAFNQEIKRLLGSLNWNNSYGGRLNIHDFALFKLIFRL